MAVNSPNSSDPTVLIKQLAQTASTAAAGGLKAAAVATLEEVGTNLSSNAASFNKDTLSKVNTDIGLLTSDLTQGLSLDGGTQDQHMQNFITQVQALGITLTGSSAASVSQTTNATFGNQATSAGNVVSSGASLAPSGSLSTPIGGTQTAASAPATTGTTNASSAAATAQAAGSQAMTDFNKAIANSQQNNPDGTPNASYNAAGWKQAASTAAQSFITTMQTYEGTLGLSPTSKFKTAIDSAISNAKSILSQFSNGTSGTEGNAVGTSLGAITGAIGQVTNNLSSIGLGGTYGTTGATGGGQDTAIVKSKWANDMAALDKGIKAVTAGASPMTGDKVDTAITDMQAQLTSIYGANVPADVQTKMTALSALRDKWIAGNGALGNAVADASNQLAASIATNQGGGSAGSWGDTGYRLGQSTDAATPAAGAAPAASTASTSANHDWANAKVNFSQSDITNAVNASPPNVSKLAGYLSTLGGKLGDKDDNKLVSGSSKDMLSDLTGALTAKPSVKQDIANAFAKFSSNGIKDSANKDQKKAYDAVLSGILTATGLSGNKSVDKRGKTYVGDNYTASI